LRENAILNTTTREKNRPINIALNTSKIPLKSTTKTKSRSFSQFFRPKNHRTSRRSLNSQDHCCGVGHSSLGRFYPKKGEHPNLWPWNSGISPNSIFYGVTVCICICICLSICICICQCIRTCTCICICIEILKMCVHYTYKHTLIGIYICIH
jgi:hypothetical protein